MTALIVILVILLVIVLGLAGAMVGSYNSLVSLRNKVQEAWRQIDVELNRRYDLIPNLVETVKGYAAHESDTLENVIRMRNQARGAASSDSSNVPSEQRTEAEAQLSQAVHQILVTAEAYPELKADAGFRQLAGQLEGTEDRIANGRRYYNALVSDYNTKIESFPSNIVANMGGFKKAGYYEVEDPNVRQSPRVDFGQRDDQPQDRAITDGDGYGAQPQWDQTPGELSRGQLDQPTQAPQYDVNPGQQGFDQRQ